MFYEMISYDEYAKREGLRSSQLKDMREEPYKASPSYRFENPQEETTAFTWGKAVHSMVEHRAHETPDIAVFRDGKTRGSKAFKAFEANNKGKILLLESEFDSTSNAFDSLNFNDEVREALDGSVFEASWFWTDKETGLKCKIRSDIYQPETHHVYDLKTTHTCSRRAFAYDSRKYGYTHQAAFYADGIKQITGKRPDFFFILVAKSAPHKTAMVEVDHALIDHYIKLNRFYMRQYADCLESGNWPNSDYFTLELNDYEREQDV